MNAQRILVLGILGIASAAFAQQGTSYDGTWLAEYTGRTTGRAEEATLIIKGKVGTWQNRRGGRQRNRCVGLEVPVEVTRATATELEVTTYGSKVLTGCRDDVLVVKRVDDKTLKGVRNETPLRLTRQ